jgi:hypothetical protein
MNPKTGRPLKLTPATTNGAKILAFCRRTYGSISAAARAAGVSDPTLRARIYAAPTRLDSEVRDKLVAAGIKREWLAAPKG